MKRLTIYDIKRLSRESSPYFFTRKTMRFFGQTLKMYRVYKQPDGRYFITCPMIDHNGQWMGNTERYFNPTNNKLERV